jgi:four helix bundle protein
MGNARVYDLEERLVSFALSILSVVDSLPDTRVCNHIGNQLLRSGTSPALNYGEAQAAESKKDFCHKLQVILKELREYSISLKILFRRGTLENEEVLIESRELVAIFSASVKTTKAALYKQNRKI